MMDELLDLRNDPVEDVKEEDGMPFDKDRKSVV